MCPPRSPLPIELTRLAAITLRFCVTIALIRADPAEPKSSSASESHPPGVAARVTLVFSESIRSYPALSSLDLAALPDDGTHCRFALAHRLYLLFAGPSVPFFSRRHRIFHTGYLSDLSLLRYHASPLIHDLLQETPLLWCGSTRIHRTLEG
jgi:hypothetical protein